MQHVRIGWKWSMKSKFGKNPQDGVHGQPEIPKATYNQQAEVEKIHI